MTIELHTWNTPNGRKISVALEEMGLPYKVIPVNISKGEQMAPAFLAISPNNKIPAIVDPDGPGGKRVSVFESGAILLYLGEKTGKFLPEPLIERIPVYEWLMWQMGGFGPMPGQVHHFIALENEQDRAYGLKRFMAETRRLYGVLDRRLATREFVAGAAVGRRFCHPRLGLAAPAPQGRAFGLPQCQRWYDALMARPARQARHGSEAGLSWFFAPCSRSSPGKRAMTAIWRASRPTPAAPRPPSAPQDRRARCPSASAAPAASSGACRGTARSIRRRARSWR